MSTEIDNAIKLLASKVTTDTKPDEAMKFTQAALNLAHVKATLAAIKAAVSAKR